MGVMGIFGMLFSLAAFVCWIIILIDAFKNEVWKGILGFFCGLYLIYYAIAEFQASNKWLIVGVWLAAAVIGGGLIGASGLSTLSHSGIGTGAPLNP